MPKHYLIYADESEQKGKYYSNFYGAALLDLKYVDQINSELKQIVRKAGIEAEVKWQRVCKFTYQTYIELIDKFFDYIDSDLIKIRIMFTKNSNVPIGLTKEHTQNRYRLLYYQFIKHSFGLRYCNPSNNETYFHIYLDKMPDKKENVESFRRYLCQLTKIFRRSNLIFLPQNITEIDSKKHIILQCLDLILGSIPFRLNDVHLEKIEGKRIRALRTRLKEKVYKHILMRIRKIHPYFNIGVSTGSYPKIRLWDDKYRHWEFVSSNSKIDRSRNKPKK